MNINFEGISKGNIDEYLTDLASEIKRAMGAKAKIELVVVGGASIVINYAFRKSTNDIDAVNSSISSIRSCIRNVADHKGLPYSWLNFDFKTTVSYSPKLVECSRPYKRFKNVLSVYCITDEYLLCMKLVSFRIDKDISDIEGIIESMGDKLNGKVLNYAMNRLYDGWDRVGDKAFDYISNRINGIPPRQKNSVIKKIAEYKNVTDEKKEFRIAERKPDREKERD